MSGGSFGRRVAAIGRRVRADYGGKDRAAEYRTLLETARDAGYALVSLGAFRAAVAADADAPSGPILALRHDIDVVDVAGNEAFLAAETAVGATATYYLRLATAPAHAAFVGRLHDAGFEVGYHYEEAATLAKRIRARDRAAVDAAATRDRGRLPQDVDRFRARLRPRPPLGRQPRRLDEPRPRVPQQRVRDAGAAGRPAASTSRPTTRRSSAGRTPT